MLCLVGCDVACVGNGADGLGGRTVSSSVTFGVVDFASQRFEATKRWLYGFIHAAPLLCHLSADLPWPRDNLVPKPEGVRPDGAPEAHILA